ncbi:uncharacterized protein LOC117297479 isoform X2 [Asterias rubens]|uniref:uncharacterized protein LOC117297479 isoform X2 n=1 Tax=Asterias rubens TaxID=7604 RepID=UPI0014556588|nr:uncharacterized protein LOC117297479 isoform X2 [Asterias rubens]
MVCRERGIAFSWVYFLAVFVLHNIGASFAGNSSNSQHLLPVRATNLTCTSNNFRNPYCCWVSGDNVNATELLQHSEGHKWKTGNETSRCEGTICCTHDPERSSLYYYQVNTTNSYGSVASDSLRFGPKTGTVLGPPYDVRIRNKSQSVLEITWHIPPGDSTGHYFATKLRYKIQYKWEGKNQTWKDVEEVKVSSGLYGTYSLVALTEPYGLYYVRMKAFTRYGDKYQSQYSEEAKNRTSEIAPKVPPSDFHCKADPSSDGETRVVTLTWELQNDTFKSNGEILGFNIIVKQANKSKQYSVEPNKTSHIIPDLDPSAHYKLSIQTVNSMGASPQEDCSIDPLPAAPVGLIPVLIACGLTIGLIISLVCIYQRIKKSMTRFPDIQIRSQLTTDNLYSANTTNRETEIFDDLIPHRLFVNLVPEDGVMTNGFDIGDKPRKIQVSGDTIKMHTFESQPLLPGFRDKRSRSEEFCFDEYGGGGLASSPVSVGSGGSYLPVRNDDMAYQTMTKDGLSPVEKEDPKGATGGGFHGFQELHPRPEDDGCEEGASMDAYTRMAALLPTHGAGGKQRGTPTKFGGKRHPKESAPVSEDNAAYTSDGSVANYTQQGFAARSASQDDLDAPYVLGTNPTESYSQVGLRDRANHPSPLNHRFQNQATGGLGPHDEYLRMGINPSDQHQAENEDSDFEDSPFILNDDILQNIPRPDLLQISPNLNHTASPLMALSPRDTTTGLDALLIPSSMRTASPNDDVPLRYVTVQSDSESLDQEDAETEQDGDGYVTQGLIPEGDGYVTQGRIPEGDHVAQGRIPEGDGYVTQGMIPEGDHVVQGRIPEGDGYVTQGMIPEGRIPEGNGYVTQGMIPEGNGLVTQGMIPEENGYVTQGVIPEGNGLVTQGMIPEGNGYVTQGMIPEGNGYVTQGMIPEGNGYVTQGVMTEGNGYVTQGMIPEIQNPRTDNRNALTATPNLHSDYVDQEQLNSFPTPQAEAIPVANNHPQHAPSPNDYVTPEQVFDIVSSPGPASNAPDETSTNSNNNCEGSSDGEQSDDDTNDASEFMIQGNDNTTQNRPTDDRVVANSTHPTSVLPNQIPFLSPLSQPLNVTNGDFSLNGGDLTHGLDLELTGGEEVDATHVDQQSGKQGDAKGERQDPDGGYVTHDEMQNIARVASPTS